MCANIIRYTDFSNLEFQDPIVPVKIVLKLSISPAKKYHLGGTRMPSSQPHSPNQIALSADIVAAYVAHNSVPRGDLADLIHSVHAALSKLGAVTTVSEPQALLPAVSIRRSITPAYLICLYDGKRFKSLRRHLASHGMTPDQYRQKWNLREDYPMVAPDYAATRSALAKKIGLGQFRRESGNRKLGRTPKAVVEKAES
jgi:predicted transcriptional regulator